MKKQNEFCRVIRTIFPKMVKSCPGLFLLSALLSVSNSLCMGALIYCSQDLYDCVVQAIGSGVSKSEVMNSALIFGGITVSNQILNGLSVYVMGVMFEMIQRDLTYELHAKTDRLKAAAFESEDIFDRLQRAVQGRDESIFLLFICFTPLTCHLPLYLMMGNYLHTLHSQFVWAVLLIFLPICVSYVYKVRAKSMLADRSAEPKRKMDYYYQCMTERSYFKETRLLGAVPFFKSLFDQSMELVNQLEITFRTRNLKIDLIAKLMTMIGYGVVLYMLVDSVISGVISIGAFAAALNGIGLLFDEMKELVSDDIGENIGSVGSIKNLLSFFELAESEPIAETKGEAAACSKAASASGAICFKNVSFRYPHSSEYALKHIDLEIKPGERIALVGENGSGKTTLTKLLLGLYEPDEGEIIIEGEMRKSAVFQDFRRYEMTLKENIAISDISANIDEDAVSRICAQVGISLNVNTGLGTEFSGIDLSGGQWQRIAIARGLYRKHDLIVLDEPAAAIDPLEESAIYRQFVEIIKNRTSVLVTHRIGSAQIADRIIVMNRGRCVDSGTHQELMKRCRIYQEMYQAQADLYKE